MADLKNTNDIKKAVLQICGELTNGNSPYDTVAVAYINKVQKALYGGGNLFDTDLSDPWPWARSARPIVMKLLTDYITGTVTATQGSYSLTFSDPPIFSAKGYMLKVEQTRDFYFIRSHTASSANFQIDQQWYLDSGAYNFKIFTLDYDVIDNTIIVEDKKYLDFTDSAGSQTATLTECVYSISDFITEVQSKMNAVSADTFTVSFSAALRTFTISSSGSVFSILAASGSNALLGAWGLLGMGTVNKTGALSYGSDRALNAIQRLIKPITTYQTNAPNYWAAEDTGKIFGIDTSTMQNKFPIAQMTPFMPDHFCELEKRDNGTIKIRFNAYPIEESRIEVDYIPIAPELFDNQASIPAIPEAYREILVYGAAYFLFLDKRDDLADKAAQMAKAAVEAMKNDFRSGLARTNNRFGRIIPRKLDYRPWRIIL